jgi:hypothetical protein
MLAAAVNRPASMNAQQGAFCSRTNAVALSQASYPLINEMVLCLGRRSEIPMVCRQQCIHHFLAKSRKCERLRRRREDVTLVYLVRSTEYQF